MKKYINKRRKAVLKRLEEQLKKGTKPLKELQIPLTDKDKTRINNEIDTLKLKIK